MAADETPEDRLEAALERIAKIVDAAGVAQGGGIGGGPEPVDSPRAVASDVAARLDRIIETLRQALGEASAR